MVSASIPSPANLLAFCGRSLFREYGWSFFRRIAWPHPVKTARAVRAAAALDVSGGLVDVPGPAVTFGGARCIVGVGFCLKPLDPPCPSGRFNHDCAFLENFRGGAPTEVPAPCRSCAIRECGRLALRAGAAFYVMTSARDILLDVFAPALDRGTFAAGAFALCRYSLRPFAVGLLAAGDRGWMWAFASGDCRDYPTWLRADNGDKPDRTEIAAADRQSFRDFLRAAAQAAPPARFEKRGNVLHPRTVPA
jgi:hypothetical protein